MIGKTNTLIDKKGGFIIPQVINSYTWERFANLPYPFYNSKAVVFNNEIHILGSGNSTHYKKHYKYDGNTWTSVSTLPYNFYNGCVVVYNNELHILSGTGGATSHYKWDGNTWTSVSTLPLSFANGQAIIHNNEIHIFGGTSHYKWDGATWTSVSTLPYSFNGTRVASYKGKIHLFGGTSHSNDYYILNETDWVKQSINTPYSFINGEVFVYNGNIYLMGCNINTSNYNRCAVYNGEKWILMPNLPYYFYSAGAVFYNDRLYLLGSGYSSYQSYFMASNDDKYIYSMKLPYGAHVSAKNIEIAASNDISIVSDGFISNKDNLDTTFSVSKKTPVTVTNNKSILYMGKGVIQNTVSLPYKLYEGAALTYNEEMHILGGADNTTSHYKWNGETWVVESILPYEFRNSEAIVFNNEIHILGTSVSGSENKHYKYDGNTWTSVSTLPYNFYNGCVVVYNNELHILGGTDPSTNQGRTLHYKWNGTEWVSDIALHYRFHNGVAAAVNNFIYIIGGTSYNTTAYRWSSGAASWQDTADPFVVEHSSIIVFNNEMHVLGSDYGGATRTQHYRYNTSNFIWNSVSTLPYNFGHGCVLVYNNQIHMLGGYDSRIADSTTNHYVWNGYAWKPFGVTGETKKILGLKNMTVDGRRLETNEEIIINDNPALIQY